MYVNTYSIYIYYTLYIIRVDIGLETVIIFLYYKLKHII